MVRHSQVLVDLDLTWHYNQFTLWGPKLGGECHPLAPKSDEANTDVNELCSLSESAKPHVDFSVAFLLTYILALYARQQLTLVTLQVLVESQIVRLLCQGC